MVTHRVRVEKLADIDKELDDVAQTSLPGRVISMTHGKICYLEIPTIDIERSVPFTPASLAGKHGSAATERPPSTSRRQRERAWVTGRSTSPSPGLMLYIMVDSVTQTEQAIVAHGGRIVQPLCPGQPELIARFADPDGNVLGIYQEPSK